MRIVEREFKEIISLKREYFINNYIDNEPLITIFRYEFLNCAGVIFCPPKGFLWKFKIKPDIFIDPFFGVNDDEIERKFLQDLGDFKKSDNIFYGVSSVADNLDYSEMNNNPGAIPFLLEVRKDQIDAVISYLGLWWNCFKENALLKSDIIDVRLKLKEVNKLHEKNPILILLNDVWSLQLDNKNMHNIFSEVKNKIIPCFNYSNIEFDEWLEFFGYSQEKVNRDYFIPSRPNKKIINPLGADIEVPDLSLRDNLFSIQCALVNKIKTPSMYWGAHDAYYCYDKSINKYPITFQVMFDWRKELDSYMGEMKKRYEVLNFEEEMMNKTVEFYRNYRN